jgi:hypothetical protein
MAEFRVRFVAEDGSAGGDGSANDPFRLPSEAIDDLGTLGGFHSNPGVVMIGEGDFTETSTVEVSRDLTIEGGLTYGGGIGGTRWIRGHSGDFFEPDPTYTDWAHHLQIRNLTIDGNKASFGTAADLVRILRPGFHCRMDSVTFRNSSGWGLFIDQGANNFHGYDLGFNGCDLGGIKHVSTTAGGGFGQWCAYFGMQIDGSGPDAIYIEQDKAARSNFYFAFPEFETGLTNCITTNLTSAANQVAITVDGLVSQGATTMFKETGTEPALWVINHASGAQVFDGINESMTDTSCGIATFGAFGGSASGIRVGGVAITTDTANPTHSAPTGSLHVVKNAASSRLYQNTSASDPGSTWTQIS